MRALERRCRSPICMLKLGRPVDRAFATRCGKWVSSCPSSRFPSVGASRRARPMSSPPPCCGFSQPLPVSDDSARQESGGHVIGRPGVLRAGHPRPDLISSTRWDPRPRDRSVVDTRRPCCILCRMTREKEREPQTPPSGRPADEGERRSPRRIPAQDEAPTPVRHSTDHADPVSDTIEPPPVPPKSGQDE